MSFSHVTEPNVINQILDEYTTTSNTQKLVVDISSRIPAIAASEPTMGSFASKTANTLTLLPSTDASHDFSSKEQLIESEHNDATSLSRSTSLIRASKSRILLWGVLMNAGILLAGFGTIWVLNTNLSTNLRDVSLTKDGKSFPVGRLTWSQQFQPLPCGKTPTEALARGCHFDVVATAWLPPRCIDDDLIAEFELFHPWQYFHDQNGTQSISNTPDELGTTTGLIWTSHRWHAAHCLFMWKKLNRALLQGRWTDGETIKQSHTDHCLMSIMDSIAKGESPDEIGALVEVIYPPC